VHAGATGGQERARIDRGVRDAKRRDAATNGAAENSRDENAKWGTRAASPLRKSISGDR